MKTKKLFFFAILFVSTQLNSVNFDTEIEEKIRQGVDYVVKLGNENLYNFEENGALNIYKQLQQDIAVETVRNLMHQEAYRPVKKFCAEIFSEICLKDTYNTYLDAAICATKKDPKIVADEWTIFRKKYLNLLTDLLMQKTKIEFNRDPSKLVEFLDMNESLEIKGVDNIHLKASVFLLYYAQQVQKEEIEKITE